MMKTLSLLLLVLTITGCAQYPKFDTRHVDKSLLPTQVASDLKAHKGKNILWGGTILSGKNLKKSTRLEVLAYPLDGDGWPERDQKPLGRFILSQAGYLETADYAKGRVITVLGSITGIEKGKVGDSAYTYPLVQVQQLHLWEKIDRKSGTGFHFGVGVMFH
ncbi:MAG: Slp family lipoprotein [Gammaproteobacteria bacterium]|nr:Slp family lipoprotein [Gammaproteobacteria bacterium]